MQISKMRIFIILVSIQEATATKVFVLSGKYERQVEIFASLNVPQMACGKAVAITK